MGRASLLIVALLIANLAMANRANIAKVVKVKGEVSRLIPGDHEGRDVKIGDKYPEDTSIVTGNKSFVLIKMEDQTQITMRADSKLILTSKKQAKPGIINLLKGQLRANVVPTKNGTSNKLFIQTRTAAMGVRGTDFTTTYNPENKITSVVTVKGRVAMAKIDDTLKQKVVSEVAKDSAKDVVKEVVPIKQAPLDESALADVLKSEKTVEVSKGRYSGVTPNKEKASIPIRISPQQLVTLTNADKAEKDKVADVKVEDDAQEAPPEGIDGGKDGDFAARAGGYVDLSSGIYVPPPKKSKFDEEKKVFIPPKAFGTIDKVTGDYQPPAGLKLDANKGFVIDQKTKEVEYKKADIQKSELLAELDILNQDIKRDVLVPVVGDKVTDDQIFPQKAIDRPDPWHGKFIAGFGLDSNVTESNYEETVVQTDTPSTFLNGLYNVSYTTGPNGKWEFNPELTVDGLYYNRGNAGQVRRNNGFNATGDIAGLRKHTLNFYPAFFKFGLRIHNNQRAIDSNYGISTHTSDVGIFALERFKLNEKMAFQFGVQLSGYEGKESYDQGNLFILSAKFDRKMTEQQRLEFDASIINKSVDPEKFQQNYPGHPRPDPATLDREIWLLGVRYTYNELFPNWNVYGRIDLKTTNRENDDDREIAPTLGAERFLSKSLDLIFSDTYSKQTSNKRQYKFDRNIASMRLRYSF